MHIVFSYLLLLIKKIVAKYKLLLFFSFCLFILFPQNSHPKETAGRTIVTVIEGEVMCINLTAETQDARVATFLYHMNKYVGIISINGEQERAYITPEHRETPANELTNGITVLVLPLKRASYVTDWDIVDILSGVSAGNEYHDGVVAAAETAEVNEILDIVLGEKTPTGEPYESTIEGEEEQDPEQDDEEYIDPDDPDPDLDDPDEDFDDIDKDEDNDGEGEGPEEEEEEQDEEDTEPVIPPEPEPPTPTPDPEAPTAVIAASPTSGAAPLTVNFDGSGSTDPDGNINSYDWDFGDGDTGSGVAISHTYSTEATYTATLTVTDDQSLTDNTTVTITVSAEPRYYYVDPVNGNNTSGDGSNLSPWKTITYALANYDPAVSTTITLASGTYNTSTGETFPLEMQSNITIIGAGATTSIDAGGTGSVFNCGVIDSTTIRDLRMTGGIGYTTGAGFVVGGAINTGGTTNLLVYNCYIYANSATDYGGAIIIGQSTATISNCTLADNTATSGGAIYVTGTSTTTIKNCTIDNNEATTSGGALYTAVNSTTTITNSTIKNNQAGGTGGAIYSASDSNAVSIYNSNIVTNSAVAAGGIHFQAAATLTLEDNTIAANSSTHNYDGILFAGTTLLINRCKIADHNTKTFGVYINNSAVDVRIINSLFTNNLGALYIIGHSSSTYTVTNCTFSDNTTQGGISGAIVFASSGAGTLTVKNSIIANTDGFGITDVTATGSRVMRTNYFYNNTVADYRYGSNSYSTTNALNNLIPNSSKIIGSDVSTIINFKGTSDYHLSDTSPTGVPGVVDNPNVSDAPSLDMDGRSRDSEPDIGCYEYVPGDPPITVNVYDSITSQTVTRPVVGIYTATGTQVAVTTNNPHTFNVTPGRYFIAVAKESYGFPSQVVAKTVPGDHGDIFEAGSDALNINIPIDPDGWLSIEKTANKKRVRLGEIITYNIKIKNKNWFQDVNNVQLVDDIVNGFKYASGTTYKGPTQLTDPVISGRKAVFNVGTINRNSTMNISYQVRVGTGIPEGKYKATAHTRKSTDLARNSNYDSVELEVTEDPIFTRGTIIGKVFYDLNGNGVQDMNKILNPKSEILNKSQIQNSKFKTEECGIPGVRIYTEYGVVVETDEDGKYHIADVPAGNHLLKVDPSTLPTIITSEQKLVAQFTTDNPYYIQITEGLLGKVNFGVELADSVERSADSKATMKKLLGNFFIVALGEGTVSNLNTSGNIEMTDKDDRYDEGVHVDGRLAFYLKGKVLGKYLITASMDTERLPGHKYRSKDLFTNLDPDQYYPVYGDASKVDYSGLDTQDVGYVFIQWDDSFAKWGSFHTEFPLYKRTLSGGIINYKSVGKTKFGDPWTKVRGFGATSRQQAAHDEFVGTGGSLYYLRHDDVTEGSEKLRVEVRNRISKNVIHSFPLAEEMDYEIDYDAGRIILKKPLNGVQQSYASSIISNDILMGSRVYLVIDYEYYGDGLTEQAWGLKASQQLGHHLRVGGSYVEEQRPGKPYKVYGGNTTLKINKDTTINAHYNHSQETQLGSNLSYDGGLNFTEQYATFSNGKDGNAYGINGRTVLFDNTDIYVSYSKQDPYFSATDSISQQGSEKYIANIVSRLTEYLSAGLGHITQRYFKETTIAKTFGDRDNHITTGTLDYERGKWDLRAEYQHQSVKNPATDFTYFGTLPYLNNDFIAGRVGYQLFSWLHTYLRGQATVRGKVDNQGTLGADIEVWKDTIVNIAETVGNLGNSTLVGITTKMSEGTDVYANIEVGNNLNLGKYTKTTYGQSTKLGPNSRAYMEEDYSSYRENLVRGTLLGYDQEISDTFAVGIAYERSHIKHHLTENAINRDSGSVAFSYLNPDCLEGIEAYTKLECRQDRGTDLVRQWLTENDLLWRLNTALTISGRGNWGWAENRTNNTDEAEFYEVGTGFSFRPVSWDRLNVLGKYNYLTNLPPDSQWDFIENMESRRHVYALEGAFDICRYLQLVGKVAYRDLKEKVGYRHWTHSDTYLYIARSNFHIMNANKNKPFMLRGWDLGVEYRILANDQIEDKKKGFLVELDKDIGNYLRFGVGYNFTDYDDDLRNEDKWDAKGFFVRVNGKY